MTQSEVRRVTEAVPGARCRCRLLRPATALLTHGLNLARSLVDSDGRSSLRNLDGNALGAPGRWAQHCNCASHLQQCEVDYRGSRRFEPVLITLGIFRFTKFWVLGGNMVLKDHLTQRWAGTSEGWWCCLSPPGPERR